MIGHEQFMKICIMYVIKKYKTCSLVCYPGYKQTTGILKKHIKQHFNEINNKWTYRRNVYEHEKNDPG